MPKEKQKSVSVKFPRDTIDWIEEERAKARPILPASEVVRREFEKGRSGGGVPFEPPALAVHPLDVDEVREAMYGPAGTRPSLEFSKALLRFYDEVMALAGGGKVDEPRNAAGFTAAEQAEIDAYARTADAQASAQPITAGSRPKFEVRR